MTIHSQVNSVINGNERIMDKKSIREQVRAIRDNMTTSEMFSKSNQIFEQLIVQSQYRKADKIFTYVSCNNEVDTIMLIDYSLSIEKRVFVPKVVKNDMLFYEISDISELSPGYRGIFEPSTHGKDPDYSKTGLICMPGIAFDKNRNRIGYGGGFFDRYLQGENNLYKVALAYDYQVFDNIPSEETDIRPDMIITETEWF